MAELSDIKGIGAKTLALLNKINIRTIDDLVTHYPFRYDVLKRDNLSEVEDGGHIVIDGKVESVPILLRFKGGLTKMNFRLVSSSGVVGVSIFNRAFLKSKLPIGTSVIVIGKLDKKKNVITASDIKIGLLSNKEKIEAVYHATSGLSNKNLSAYINLALLSYGRFITDNIPKYLQEKYNFSNKKTALNIVHNPPSFEKLEEAKNRLKYEELFEFMLKINYLKMENRKKKSGVKKEIDKNKIYKFIKELPFELTDDQKNVIEEILNDLGSDSKMNRLLQGDVGSGKTIVSIIGMYANYLSGYQSALMAPTEILATQHYNTIKDLFKNYDINICLLTGSVLKKDKTIIYEKLKSGEIDIIIGTHALIQDEVEYKALGFVITDEQHRFGVNQRLSLQNKGQKPDILYMSATPIPRTYALTIYGDMDVSIIKQRPKGRKPIKTYVKKNSEMTEVLQMMYDELKLGHQIYVIAPLIEDSENSDLTTVNELRDKMTLAFGKKYKIDMIHGKMTPVLKDNVMNNFKDHNVDILISTTVIEVGVDVENATMMVIFDASRFGLSTLHQLRGRVGRSSFDSKCVLISDIDTKRLEVLENTEDGFEISEEDFKLRGHGDLFGTKQSGDMTFKLASLREDYKLLLQTKKDSYEYLNNEVSDDIKDKLVASIKSS